jgi:hypothetical protein
MTPSCTFGQRNSPSSRRFEMSTTPVPSQKISFTRSVRLAPEHVDRARERVGARRLAHQRRQAVCSLAEIHGTGCDQHPDLTGGTDHDPAFKAQITAAIAFGLASAPIRTTTSAISSSIPSAPDPRTSAADAVQDKAEALAGMTAPRRWPAQMPQASRPLPPTRAVPPLASRTAAVA